MCPECVSSISTMAMALVGVTTSGGITALVLPGFFGRKKDGGINIHAEEQLERKKEQQKIPNDPGDGTEY